MGFFILFFHAIIYTLDVFTCIIMGKNFHLQEKLFHFSTIHLLEILDSFERFDGKKDINGLTIPLNHTINIPFVQDKPFYAVRIVPYVFLDGLEFSIPNIELYGHHSDTAMEFVIDNQHCSIRALFDGSHPWYKITRFEATYEYIRAILDKIDLRIQVIQHLDEDPLREVGSGYCDTVYSFGISKDGIIHHSDITFNKTQFSLQLESLLFSNIVDTFARTMLFSVAYPVHKSMLLTSFIVIPDSTKSKKITWITYDDSFYSKPWVPLQRSFFATLNFSGKIVQ